ncbi:Transmembrane protein [Ceratobasidium theobromae]|uniref:Transmembrane protein n=1 Tax=Ceratobasidium theobromae TaxID=1582974 RepID=A0A5N5QQB5_9AGAM|nr:Transmembrane protein [Ceratobasidium theobromae]
MFTNYPNFADVRNVLIVWFVVFWICLFIPLLLGFGPAGVIAGSIAAGFQSAAYGAFTPAGGLFAVLTSVGMLGIASPPAVITAVVVASVAGGLTWSIVAPA